LLTIKAKRLIVRNIFLFCLALGLVAGCNSVSDGLGETIYKHALDGAPASLDPARADNIYAATVVVNLYDTLYRYRYLARPYDLTPNLASGFPAVSADGLTYTIQLLEGVHFHDDAAFAGGKGRELTSTDVIYSLMRHFDPATRSRGAWLWRGRIEGLDAWGEKGADYDQPVSGLTALDDYTLKIRLTAPYPQFTFTLSNALSAIVPREAVEHYEQEFGIRPVGSGPFRLLSLDETRAVLERNPAFDRGPFSLVAEGYEASTQGQLGLEPLDGRNYPFLDRLEIHFIGEPSARWSSFASGRDVHNAMVPSDQAERILVSRDPVQLQPEMDDRYHHLLEQEAGFVYFGFNMANPALGHHEDPDIDAANRELRCAIRDAYNWQARNESFHNGMGEIFSGIIPPLLSDFDPELSARSARHNPERARDRLAEAGWSPERFPVLTYGMESSVHQRQIFEQFRAKMTEAGLPASMFQPRSFASFGDMSRAIANRQLDIFMMSWTLAYPDAQYNLQLFYGPNAAPGANSFNYANPAYDRLFEQASPLPAGPLRSDLYRRMNEMIIDDCVAISGLSRTRLHLWQRQVIMLPDREMLGGHFLRFVDIADKAAAN